MPPHRSDASAAAAPATTRSGRVKPVSKAALASVASETHEHQQARRSRTGGKSARRSGANAQGQTVAAGTPKVTISGKAVRSSQRRRSPLRPLDNTSVTSQARPRPTSTHPPSLSLPRYSATRTITASTSFTTQGPRASATEQSLDILATAASSQRRQAPTSIPIADTTVAGNGVSAAAAEDCMEEDEVEDGEERHGDHRWRDDRDDSDEGNSDAYVPSDPGDGVEAGDAMDTGGDTDEDEDEDGGDTGNGRDEEVGDGEDEEDSGSKKGRARRHSKKTKKNPPKASDYSPEVEALLNHASGYMRSLVVSENPMPSVDDSIGLAADAFEVAKADRPHVDIPDEIAYISILRRCVPQVRGKVKDAARARAGDAYGFDDRPSMQPKNQRRYLALVDQDAYVYEKPDTFQGPYYHQLCFKILKTCFFSKSTDDGIAFSEWFSPIRMETIALVFTAIRLCLDDWKSGAYKPLTFTSDVYEPVYQVHLANLRALEADDPDFVKGLGEELWEDCSEPFDLQKARKPTTSITDTHKANGVMYGQERRNARAARKAAPPSDDDA